MENNSELKMPTSLILSYPLVDDNGECCCVGNNIITRTSTLNIRPIEFGYVGSGNFSIGNNDYNASINLSVNGDEISGSAKFKHYKRNIITDNVLGRVQTSFPYFPIDARWDGLKLNGFGNFCSLSLLDSGYITGSLNTTSSVRAVITATAVNSSNVTVSSSSRNFLLRATNANAQLATSSWESFDDYSVRLTVPVGSEVSIITFNLLELFADVSPSIVGVSGKLSYTVSSSNINITTNFKSPQTRSMYNISFPWINSWDIINTVDYSILGDSEYSRRILTDHFDVGDIHIVLSLSIRGLA